MEEDARSGYTGRTSKMTETEEQEKERLLIGLAFCYDIGGSKETKGGECDYGCNGGNLVEPTNRARNVPLALSHEKR
jgi:hypothetical protein